MFFHVLHWHFAFVFRAVVCVPDICSRISSFLQFFATMSCNFYCEFFVMRKLMITRIAFVVTRFISCNFFSRNRKKRIFNAILIWKLGSNVNLNSPNGLLFSVCFIPMHDKRRWLLLISVEQKITLLCLLHRI